MSMRKGNYSDFLRHSYRREPELIIAIKLLNLEVPGDHN